jgi:UDP-N-acetylglucosamine 2-epimerase
MKITTIIGARPQFIKAAIVNRAVQKNNMEGNRPEITEVIVHTGQHYDDNMSAVFFRELNIPEPDLNLGVGSGQHGQQTGQMLIRIEEVLLSEKPDWVIVYGDTNSTLAGALAAAKLKIPIAHVEAGLRSFNREMPEEYNRVLADHCSDFLFCPTQTAVQNLKHEGITEGVHWVGDVMCDSVLYNIKLAEKYSRILEKLNLKPKNYVLATVHRAENTDEPKKLKSIFCALDKIAQNGWPVIIPLHPRTLKKLNDSETCPLNNLLLIDPVSYLDMLLLEKQAKVVLTDSGGIQKEAFWLQVPCVTLRNETEWVETVETGWNYLAGTDKQPIINAFNIASNSDLNTPPKLFGNGNAGDLILQYLISAFFKV